MIHCCAHCGRPLAAEHGAAHLPEAPGNCNGQKLRYLLVKSADVLRMLRVSEIDWIEAEGHHVRIRVRDEVITVRQRISSLEQALDPVQFPRIHRSTIVNVERIRELRHWFGGDYQVVLWDGTVLKLSRNYRDRLTTYSLEEAEAQAP
ncbi:MAG TPA: LytTR family DNA-binding domain-containing protein [Longimicrobium sp.]|nr:LytTR family DNA-binding domain-containing protein [Longimicrobium sp.]